METNSISKKTTLYNTIMLYLMTIAKILFPLITLPYLTRVLSPDCYGVVSYMKSYIIYAQLIVDFGFILSSVKDIVKAKNDINQIGYIAGHTFIAKILLSLIAFIVTIFACSFIPILKNNIVYTFLSFFVVFLSCFLADFLFRGLEKMNYITIVFIAMKSISTILTFVFVKCDSDIMWIPILDIISSLFAIIITFIIIRFKLKIIIKFKSFKSIFYLIKDSFYYFISNMATTAFGALNTLLIGIFILDLKQVSYWTVCMTVVTAVQSLYAPIINGIYPYMIKHKDLKYIHKILIYVMPIIIIGSIIGFFSSKFVLLVLGGKEYINAFWLLRSLIPLMIISFPAMLYGWPTLGSIGKVNATSLTTLLAAIVQIVGLTFLIVLNQFSLLNLAIVRIITELVLFLLRVFLTYKNKCLFIE